jgi:glycerol-3-phosphate dehydrogenase
LRHYNAIVVGGGITGVGILRDLSMRGIRSLLVERYDLSHGTSSRFHGLLHSGARYAGGDLSAAKECAAENATLRRIASASVEETEGFFVRTVEDDSEYEEKWLQGCKDSGIEAVPISVIEAVKLEPNLDRNIKSVYRVPDSAVDGFRIIWQNAFSAKKHGGEFETYTELSGVSTKNGSVIAVTLKNTLTGALEEVGCDFLINAAGPWVSEVARLAGIEVHVLPDRGLLLAFNHRFVERVINRLHKSSDADIFVPHGSVTLLGTTSVPVDNPADTTVSSKEALYMLGIGEKVIPEIRSFRILRGFAGTRPLYTKDPSAGSRAVSRNFVVLNHEDDGLCGFATIVGGKFTTYRLMAEKMADLAAVKLNFNGQCRTAIEPLIGTVEHISPKVHRALPKVALELAAERLGESFGSMLNKIDTDLEKAALLCECELISRAEIEENANKQTCHSLNDLRRRTRLGMGTCQGNFCGYRALGALAGDVDWGSQDKQLIDFVQERWHGIRPMLWGTQIKEAELSRGLFSLLFNADGEQI